MPNEQTALMPAPPTVTKPPDHWIDDLVGALTDPIIVCPAGGWEADLPENLKNELPLHRLAHLSQCLKGQADIEEASDAEALLYLYPASMAAPMGDQWTRIYLYLGTKVMGDKFPEDIREKGLDDYDLGELRRLKRWLRKKKVEARRVRRRQEKEPKAESGTDTAPKVEVRPEKCEQVKFF